MRSLSIVFMREIRERRAVFAAAFVAGLLAFPLAWAIHRASGFGFDEALSMTALVLAQFLGAGMALGLGATAIGKDLGEARLGFFLSKPIPSLALWAGKLGAAYASVLGVVLLVLLPGTLAGGLGLPFDRPYNPLTMMPVGHPFFLIFLALNAALWLLFLVLASHAAGVMVRSRSPLLLLDAVLAAAVVWSIASTVHRLTAWGVKAASYTVFGSMFLLALAALLAAGALQVAKGRCDLKRGHRVLSATLWSVLIAGCLCAAAYAHWVVHMEPQDLDRVEDVQAPAQGNWLVVGGNTRGRGPYFYSLFLLNTSTGAWRQCPYDLWSSRPTISPDGRWCAGLENTGGLSKRIFQIYLIDLRGPKPNKSLTGITLNEAEAWGSALLFSPDSSSLAVVAKEEVSVYALPDLEVRASARLSGLTMVRGSDRWRAAFEDPNRLRLFGLKLAKGPARVPTSIEIDVLDLTTKSFEKTGEIEKANDTVLRPSPDGKTLLVGRYMEGGEGLSLVDARTGAVIRDLFAASHWCAGTFLQDGGIVAVENSRTKKVLRLFDAQGNLVKIIEQPSFKWLSLGGEPKPGEVLVYAWPRGEKGWFRRGEVGIWSLDSGTLRTLNGLRPATALPDFWRASAGPAARYFTDDRGDLVQVDWSTGARKVILKLRGGTDRDGDE
jgi:ABC-type transport system involved in multi-copper enzyme maturation permease subunit